MAIQITRPDGTVGKWERDEMKQEPELQNIVVTNTDKIDTEIKTLRDRAHKFANDFMGLTNDVTVIESEVKMLSERIPLDLGVRLVRFEMKLDEINKQLAADFVKRLEFEVLKVEHDQMKKIIYGFVAIVLLAVVGALVAIVVKQ
jgi:cytochrome c biogenesis protein ResB